MISWLDGAARRRIDPRPRLRVLALLSIALCAAACTASAPQTSDLPLAGMESAREVPIQALVGAPTGLAGETVRTIGRITAAGRDPKGVWLDLVPPDQAASSSKSGAGSASQTRAVARIVMPAGEEADTLIGYRGRTLTLAATVGGPVALADGHPALAVTPLQYTTRFAEDAPPTAEVAAMSEQINRAATDVSRDIDASTTRFFGAPAYAGGTSEAHVRVRYLDPQLARPRWSVDGPVTIERTGTAAAPGYRYTSASRSAAGDVRTSVCAFRIEDGTLRSTTYDEVVRDPAEKIVEERHLDFSGTYMDKLTGETLPWPENVYPEPCIGFALAGFPFERKKIVNFYVWTDIEPAAPMSALFDGTDRVKVPAGTFAAYRIRMRFDEARFLAKLKLPTESGRSIARSMTEQLRLPALVFWVTEREPHMFVKAEGPLGPPGVTRGIVELIRLPPGAEGTLDAAAKPRAAREARSEMR